MGTDAYTGRDKGIGGVGDLFSNFLSLYKFLKGKKEV